MHFSRLLRLDLRPDRPPQGGLGGPAPFAVWAVFWSLRGGWVNKLFEPGQVSLRRQKLSRARAGPAPSRRARRGAAADSESEQRGQPLGSLATPGPPSESSELHPPLQKPCETCESSRNEKPICETLRNLYLRKLAKTHICETLRILRNKRKTAKLVFLNPCETRICKNLRNMICETVQNYAKHKLRKLRKVRKVSSTAKL